MSSALSTNETVSPNWKKEQEDGGGWSLNSGAACMAICNFFWTLKNSDFTLKILKTDSWDSISIFQLPDCLIYIVGFLTSDITQPEIATEDYQTTLKFAQYIAIMCLVHNYELYSLIYYFAW